MVGLALVAPVQVAFLAAPLPAQRLEAFPLLDAWTLDPQGAPGPDPQLDVPLLRVSDEGTSPVVASRLHAAFDSATLHIGVSTTDPALVLPEGAPGSDVLQDDAETIEIHLDPGGSRTEFWRLALSPNGSTYDAFCIFPRELPAANLSGIHFNSYVDEGRGWVATVVIPFRSLGYDGVPHGERWGLNVVRRRATEEGVTVHSWVPRAPVDEPDPALLGDLVFPATRNTAQP